MIGSASFEPACLLHHRVTGEQNALLTLITKDFGRISLWVKGRHALEGIIPLFKPLIVSWQQQGQHFKLTHLEIDTSQTFLLKQQLSSSYLYSAFYLNELTHRFLPEWANDSDLYSDYLWVLESLSKRVMIEPVLRIYERRLLIESGWLSDLSVEMMTAQPVIEQQNYVAIKHPQFGIGLMAWSGQGVNRISPDTPRSNPVSGGSLLKFQQHQLNDEHVMYEIKTLMRWCVQVCLEGRPLKSRTLFKSYKLS